MKRGGRQRRSSVSSAVVAAVVIVVVVVAAVGGYYAYISSRHPAKPVTLVIATYTGAPTQFLNMTAKLFEEEHPGVTVQIDAFPFSDYITNELTVLKAGESTYDIVTFTPTTGRTLAPYLVPLNSSIVNLSDLLWPAESCGGVIYNPSTNSSEVIGVAPWVSNVLVIYNTKYFDNATLQQEFYDEYHAQLNPWTWHNWSVVVDVSQFFVQHNITKYGVLIMDDTSGGDVESSFESIYGWFYINNQTLNCGVPHGIPGFGIEFWGCMPKGWSYPFPPPAINTTAGVEALEILQELVSYEPNPTQFQVSFDNTPELFAEGYGPAAVNYASRLAAILAQNVSPQDIGLAPLPGNYSMAGGTYFAISKYSAHKKLAEEFLQFIESPQVQEMEFLKLGLFPISKSAYHDLLTNSSIPSYEKNWLEANLISAEYGNAWEPLIPVTYQLGNALGTAIMNYLEHPTSETPQEVLNQVAAEYIQILKSYYTSTTSTTS